MSIASASIRNPVFAWMLMFGFIVFGAISVKRLPVGQYPDVDFPIISISATLEGASPEIMETDVADIIEDAVMAVEGIRDITSVCRQGTANTTIEFNLSRDIDVALQDVQARIAQAARKLPKDMEPVSINKTNPEENPFMWVALSGTRSQRDISEYSKNVLRDRFLTVEGNGDVMMGGYLERNVRIWINAEALKARGLGVNDLLLAASREHVEVPAGRLEGGTRESNVQVEGEALNLEQMRNIVIATQNGAPVYLKDVALIEDGFEDKRRTARVNGLTAQGMGIIKQHGANTVAVADAARARVKELQPNLPEGMELDVRVDTSVFIKEAIEEIEWTLVLAALLTAVVCWFFLGSISSTFNVLLAIPVSVFGTFAVMYFLGFSMNTFTLLALSLSIGIVVDDAVMVLENIYRHAEMGKDKVTAARDGAEQITFAALAATLAIIAIFLPVAFMSGIIGKFFLQFGVVLSIAVAISLLEALTLAPARCAQFLHVGHRRSLIERFAGWLFDSLAWLYKTMLRGILRFRGGWFSLGFIILLIAGSIAGLVFAHGTILTVGRTAVATIKSGEYMNGGVALLIVASLGVCAVIWVGWLAAYVKRFRAFPFASVLVLLASCVLFVLSLNYFSKLKQELVPAQDQGFVRVRVQAPVGSTVEYTDTIMKEVEQRLLAYPEINTTFVVTGAQGGDVNNGMAFITFRPLAERQKSKQRSQQTIIADLIKDFDDKPLPGCRVIVQDPSTEGFAANRRGSFGVEFALQGASWDVLGNLTETLMDDMRSSKVFASIDTDYKKGMPEIQVIPDREKCFAYNVDIKTLADTVGVLVGGQKIARFKDRGRRYDVRVRLQREDRSRTQDIGELYIRSRDGNLVQISEVAEIKMVPSLQSITRRNRERAVSMMANPAPGFSQEEAIRKAEELARERLPEGYRVAFTGTAKTFAESRDSLIFALILGLIVAYMVLASQFNSFLHPLTILLALPFSISGALMALYWTGQTLNVYSMIGIILLMGIVKKNSILLVDYTNQVRNEGKSREDALIEACPTRLRPILMTTVATIAGAIPGALMIGPGGELRVPMSVAVIGGLTISTLLTLLVVPCFYTIADEIKVWLTSLVSGGKTEEARTPAPVHTPLVVAHEISAGK